MKKLFMICFLLWPILWGYAQTKATDTLYILYDGKKHQLKEEPLGFNKHLEPIAVYKFIFDNDGLVNFRFLRAKYLDFDSVDHNKSSGHFLVNKSFLRKKKDEIIDIDEFREKGIEKSFWLFHKYNTLYLIDKTEMKKGKIPLYEVGVYSTYTPPF